MTARRKIVSSFYRGLVCSILSVPCLAKPIQISDVKDWVCLEKYSCYQITNNDTYVDQVLEAEFLEFNKLVLNDDIESIWIKFELVSDLSYDESLFINTKFFDECHLYEVSNGKEKLISSSGYLANRNTFNSGLQFVQPRKSNKTYLLQLKSITRNSRELASYFTSNCQKVYLNESYEKDYKLSDSLLFFFLGGILMMACYNVGIAICSSYLEYILLAIYNFCFVWLAINVSNIHIQYGWMETFDFERNLRFFPALIGIPIYMIFSMQFLNIKELNLKLYNVFKFSLWIYPILIFMMMMSWYQEVFFVFTISSVLLFTSTLIGAFLRSIEYTYARYFLLGNLFLLSVGFVQIASLFGLISISSGSYLSMFALMLEIICFSFAVAIKFRVSRRELIEMKYQNELKEAQLSQEVLQKEILEMEVEKKSRALSTSSIQQINLKEQLSELRAVAEIGLQNNEVRLYKDIIKQIDEIDSFEDHWNSFKIHFENVHKDFFERIEKSLPMLSQNDLKICAFMKMKLSNKEIARILNVTKKAVEQSKRRMRKKIGLDVEQDLLEYIESIISESVPEKNRSMTI